MNQPNRQRLIAWRKRWVKATGKAPNIYQHVQQQGWGLTWPVEVERTGMLQLNPHPPRKL